tara:strand:+ start:22 stop:219 length:198 start_codon:yes stop_codon:yes gene_type:complete
MPRFMKKKYAAGGTWAAERMRGDKIRMIEHGYYDPKRGRLKQQHTLAKRGGGCRFGCMMGPNGVL